MLKLDNFYGIEIDDFAHEIAILSLWLAKHQMNVEFKELFGAEIPLIPLREAANVVCGNAARVEWTEICDPVGETYVLGNPPYAGSSMQNADQKAEFVDYFGTTRYPKNLDYVSLWFMKGAEFVNKGPEVRVAFVSTNSISQGDHVGLLWPRVFESHLRRPGREGARGEAEGDALAVVHEAPARGDRPRPACVLPCLDSRRNVSVAQPSPSRRSPGPTPVRALICATPATWSWTSRSVRRGSGSSGGDAVIGAERSMKRGTAYLRLGTC